MKKLVLGLLLGASVLSTKASTWDIDVTHSSINFNVEHLGISWVAGSFQTFSGTVESEKEDFSDMKISLEIMASSVNTGMDKRDEHLNGADFFNTTAHDKITFTSAKISAGKKGVLKVEGKFTMLGVTTPITLNVTYNGTATGPYGMTRAGFNIESTVDRYAYGMKYNAPLDNGDMMLGQNVKLMSSIELVKK